MCWEAAACRQLDDLSSASRSHLVTSPAFSTNNLFNPQAYNNHSPLPNWLELVSTVPDEKSQNIPSKAKLNSLPPSMRPPQMSLLANHSTSTRTVLSVGNDLLSVKTGDEKTEGKRF